MDGWDAWMDWWDGWVDRWIDETGQGGTHPKGGTRRWRDMSDHPCIVRGMAMPKQQARRLATFSFQLSATRERGKSPQHSTKHFGCTSHRTGCTKGDTHMQAPFRAILAHRVVARTRVSFPQLADVSEPTNQMVHQPQHSDAIDICGAVRGAPEKGSKARVRVSPWSLMKIWRSPSTRSTM